MAAIRITRKTYNLRMDIHAMEQIERFAFYEEAAKAYAIVTTGESALYANIMLQKGVVKDA